ncbi:MAG: glycosyl hydrolase, partial [Chloroflexota bacterium]|nr:glycosyl hydrolase [Chloroflexota bacterium]
MTTFTCDLSQTPVQFEHFWEHTVGSGHAPLALRADWQAQLERCRRELGFRHVRFHGLLSDDMSTLLRQNGKLLYSFFNADQIVDFLLSVGVKPFVELSFMPQALASGPKTTFHYQANATPPKDYQQWATLIRKLVRHWIERYGVDEVRTWFFEVWNEPDRAQFWTGGQEAYLTLYRRTVEAIKGVDASLKVGGPATSQNQWLDTFLDFAEEHGIPVDFISTHGYPNDLISGQGGTPEEQLARVPRDIMRRKALEARRQARGRPVYYTEWNTSSNLGSPLHDQPFAAAFALTIVMSVSGLVEGYSFWTFSDIFAEQGMRSAPFHGGFGLLTVQGI